MKTTHTKTPTGPHSTLATAPAAIEHHDAEVSPLLGKHVLYMVSEADAVAINQRRTDSDSIAKRVPRMQWHAGAQAHMGTIVKAGDVFPMVIVAVAPAKDVDVGTVNGHVFLDGTDVLWARSVSRVETGSSDRRGCWFDPQRAQ